MKTTKKVVLAFVAAAILAYSYWAFNFITIENPFKKTEKPVASSEVVKSAGDVKNKPNKEECLLIAQAILSVCVLGYFILYRPKI